MSKPRRKVIPEATPVGASIQKRNGRLPEWLDDDDIVLYEDADSFHLHPDHWAYKPLAQNYEPWNGRTQEGPPADRVIGSRVMFASGRVSVLGDGWDWVWRVGSQFTNTIGYSRRIDSATDAGVDRGPPGWGFVPLQPDSADAVDPDSDHIVLEGFDLKWATRYWNSEGHPVLEAEYFLDGKQITREEFLANWPGVSTLELPEPPAEQVARIKDMILNSDIKIGNLKPGEPIQVAQTADRSLRQLQTSLPWTVRYSRDFRANPQSHKDMAHAVIHVGKAAGKLFELVDNMDHNRDVADTRDHTDAFKKYVADFVICALRAANTWPGGPFDLHDAVVERLESKNGVKL